MTRELAAALLTFAGGLGVFLLGMKHLSEGLQAVGERGLRSFMGKATAHRLSGVSAGVASTLITQSSAIITAMLVGFVSSGMMTLRQAINVVIGSNVGTTGTAWIVALVPSPAYAALGLLAAGGLLYFFVRKAPLHDLGLAALGIGLVLLGFSFMMKGAATLGASEAVRGAAGCISARSFAGVAAAAAVAAVVSAAVGSAAAVAVAMTLAAQGLIAYETAIASLLGANIGTTVTAWMASVGGTADARRTALAHTLSNVAGSMVFLPLVLPALAPAGKLLFPAWNAAAPASAAASAPAFPGVMLPIAAVHTLFAILRGALLFPFVGFFANLLERLVPSSPEEKPHLTSLNMRAKQSPVIACEQAFKEVRFMAESGIDLLESVRAVLTGQARPKDEEHIFHREAVLDNVQREITEFMGKVMAARLPQEVADRARMILRLTDEFESVSDEAPAILKAVRRLRADGQRISDVSSLAILSAHDRVSSFAHKVTEAFLRDAALPVGAAQAESRDLHQFIRSIRQGQLGRVGPEDPASSMRVLVELDILNAFERVRSYYLNIAETLAGGKR